MATDKRAKKRQRIVRPADTQIVDDTTNDIWNKNPEIIRRFLDIRRDYEQLCAEVEYILRKRISSHNIEASSISARAKTLNSFLEKLNRKHYEEPFTQVTDFAGARVVCLYRSDIDKVADIIRKDFVVIEDIDKLDELGVNQFGYGARHFIVQLGKSSSGARYDDLKKLSCEIQVRTVVQDAWAIIQHHMVYKRESQVPTQLHRKLNSLAGLFETVDDQFEQIRVERGAYLLEVRKSTGRKSSFLENELNLDSFKEYLMWKFPGRAIERWQGQANLTFDALLLKNYKKLSALERIINSTSSTRAAIIKELVPVANAPDGTTPSNLEAAIALAVVEPDWRNLLVWGEDWEKIISRHREH